ncbi:hypothetical protein GJ496_007461, partial [Pomphorhynchus laevis]
MFEGLIASILNRFFSGYIDEIDYKNLQIGLISGTVELNNLAIKQDALFQFDVPIEVCGGSIGKLKVKVPWTSIYNKPVVVNIEDVLVLIRPMTSSQLQNPEKVAEIKRAAKRKSVLQLSKGISIGATGKSDNFFGVLFDTVINNIQVIVKNIHLRYEDSISLPTLSFAAGIVLKDISASTTDEEGNLTKLDAEAKFVFKSAALSDMTMYYNTFTSNTNESILSNNNELKNEAVLDSLRTSVSTLEINSVPFTTLLKNPIQMGAKLRLNRFKDEESLNQPHFTVDANAAAIDFVINQNQALYAIKATHHFTMLSKNKNYVKFRPSVSLKEDKKAWWKYAYISVVEERIRCFSWQRIKEYRDQYKLYKKLYKQNLQSTDATVRTKNREEMEVLEEVLNIPTIVIARQQAKIEIKRESTSKQDESADESSSSLTSPVDTLYELTATEKQQLFDMLGLDEIVDGNYQPSGTTFLSVKVNLKNIGASLVREEKNIFHFEVSDIEITGSFQPSDFSFNSEIKTRTIEVKGYLDDSKQITIVRSTVDSKDSGGFFVIQFARNSANADNIEFEIDCKLLPLEIIYDYYAISRAIGAFFKDANMNIIFEAAKQNLSWLSNYSTAGLLYSIETHKRFKLTALIFSPIFIIPDKGTRGGPELAIYLGTVHISSDLSKSVALDRKYIETIAVNLYDKLKYNIDQTQVVLAQSESNWIEYFLNQNTTLRDSLETEVVTAQHSNDNASFRNFIVPLNISGHLMLSIQPKFRKLPQFVIESTLTTLIIRLSNSDLLFIYKFLTNMPLPVISQPQQIDPYGPDSFYDPSFDKLIDSLQAVHNDISDSKNQKQVMLSEEQEESVCDADVWKTCFDYVNSASRPLNANFTKMLFRFNMTKMILELSKQENSNNDNHHVGESFLKFSLDTLQCDLALTKLGVAGRFGISNVKLIDNRIHSLNNVSREILMNEERDELIVLKFRYIRPSCSYYDKLFDSIAYLGILDFSSIKFVLKQDVLTSIIEYGLSILHGITHAKADTDGKVPITSADESKDVISVTKSPVKFSAFNFNSLPVIQLQGYLNTVNWQIIGLNNRLLSDIAIQGLNLKTGVDSNHQLYVDVSLRDIAVRRTQANDFYVDIVNLLDDNVFQANLLYANGKTIADLHVGRLRIIYFSQFYFDLFDFASSLLEVDAALTKSVLYQARDTMYKQIGDAKQVIKSTGESDISLTARINAPSILVPRNNISRHCLLLQMGDLHINSGEEVVDVDATKIAIYTTIQLTLKSLQASRVYMESIDEIEVRELIIHPLELTFEVLVLIRSKSTPLDENFTLAKISSKIDLVKAELSLPSTQLFMAVLEDNILNFSSVSQLATSMEDTDFSAKRAESFIVTDEFISESDFTAEPAATSSLSSSPEIGINIVLHGVDLTIIELSDTPSQMTTTKSTRKSMAMLKILMSQVNFRSNKDGTYDANIRIGPVFIEDVRVDSKLAVRSVICPITDNKMDRGQGDYSNVNIFTADIRYTTDKDVLIIFKFGEICVNLCLPFLLYLYKFVMDAVFYLSAGTVFDMRTEGGSIIRLGDLSHTKQKFVEFDENTEIKEIEGNQQANRGKLRAIQIKGELVLPRVALYAEPEKHDSQILLLYATCDLKLIQWYITEVLEISLHMKDINVMLERKDRPAVQVLRPCVADITMKQTKESQGDIIVECKFSSICANLTPAIYSVIIGVIGSLSESGIASNSHSHSLTNLEDSQNSFEIQPLNYEKYQNIARKVSAAKQTQCSYLVGIALDIKAVLENAIASRKRKPIECLNITVGNVFVVYSEEICNELIPLMIALLSINGSLSDWSNSLMIDVIIDIDSSYFNETLNVWEPFIDPLMIHENAYLPWRCRFSYVSKPAIPLQSNLEYIENAFYKAFNKSTVMSSDQAELPEADKSAMPSAKSLYRYNEPEMASFIRLLSLYTLTINMSPAAMRLLMRLVRVITSSSKQSAEGESDIQPFLQITNKTGIPVNVVLSKLVTINSKDLHDCTVSHTDAKTSQSKNTALNQHNEPQNILSIRSSLISPLFSLNPVVAASRQTLVTVDNEHDQLSRYKFSLEFQHLSSITDLSFKKEGSVLRYLHKYDTSTEYHVLVNVNNHFSFQSITISSPTEIYNGTDIPICIYCQKGSNFPSIFPWTYEETEYPNTYILQTVQPHEYYSVPLPVLYHCHILVSPDDPRYNPVNIYDPFLPQNKDDVSKAAKESHWSTIKDLGRVIPGRRQMDDNVTIANNIYISNFLASGLSSSSSPIMQDFHFRVDTGQSPHRSRNFRNMLKPSGSVGNNSYLWSSKLSRQPHIPARLIAISPVLCIESCLPFALHLGDNVVEPGQSVSWHGLAKMTNIKAKFQYNNIEYEGAIKAADIQLITSFVVIKFTPVNLPGRHADISEKFINVLLWSKDISRHIRRSDENYTDKLIIFTPIWFYNYTGIDLELKCDKSRNTLDITRSHDLQLIAIPFSQSRQNIKIRVKPNGTWSDKVSLETIGVTSTLTSKINKLAYQLLVNITVSNTGLTRLIYITSQYTVVNNSDVPLEFRQSDQGTAITLQPGTCIPFWPSTFQSKQNTSKKQINNGSGDSPNLILYIREHNTNNKWIPFPVIDGSHFSLRIGTGLTVRTSSFPRATIAISKFSLGDSPVRLKNLCTSIDISFHQENNNEQLILHAYESILYTWPNATLSQRLFWRPYRLEMLRPEEYEIFYNMDQHGVVDISLKNNKIMHIYWYTYYENLQRTFLLTDNADLFCSIVVPDLCSMEIHVNLSEFRMSLLTDNYEFASLSCFGSKTNWKLKSLEPSSSVYKVPTERATKWLEYGLRHDALLSPIFKKNQYSVNYDKMEMEQPKKAKLNRESQAAIKLFYRQSKLYMAASAVLHSAEIYNQLNDALFPVVLFPIKRPEDNTSFAEVDIVLLSRDNIYIVRSGHISVRDFCLNVDTGFLGSLYGWFTSWRIHEESLLVTAELPKVNSIKHVKSIDDYDISAITPSGAIITENVELKKLLLADINESHISVLRRMIFESSSDTFLMVIDNFEISPISLQLSFSLNASSPDPENEERMIEELLGAIGHALAFTVGRAVSSFNNVPFRFKELAIHHSIQNVSSLIRLLQGFYILEAVKQAYVVVLGLDVLGNPYGLLKQFSEIIGKGLYDPFVSSVKDPSSAKSNINRSLEEISTGMAKTVSTASNSVSLISDHLGRLLATASLDRRNKELRNRRIHEANKGDMQDAIKYASRNFLGGCIRGVQDVFKEPIE